MSFFDIFEEMATITKETPDALHATLTINLSEADYLPKVNDSLKKLSKKVDMKGFRKGMVPVGHVKKLYGNEVLADELNKLVNTELTKYLEENKIEILGHPIPHSGGDGLKLDINDQKNYEFQFDLGLYPEFEVKGLSAETKIEKPEVRVDEKAIDEEIERLGYRYGKMVNPEDGLLEKDILFLKIQELDDAGNLKENGIESTTSIALSKFKEDARKQWLGKKPGEFLDLEIMNALDADKEAIIHHYLKQEGHPHFGKNFRFTLEKINRIEPPALDQELFDKVYGEGNVRSVDEFRQKIKEEISQYYEREAGFRLDRAIVDYFVAENNIPLPDDFLKRWIRFSNEKPISEEDVEKEYGAFSRNLKWQLISNKIRKENNLEVTKEDLKEHTMKVIRNYYGGLPSNEENDKLLSNLAEEMLKKEEHVKRSYDEVADDKVLALIKGVITIDKKEISIDEFSKKS